MSVDKMCERQMYVGQMVFDQKTFLANLKTNQIKYLSFSNRLGYISWTIAGPIADISQGFFCMNIGLLDL
jgi:hypothetical protein